ncbi:zinc ABC transporter substrate-binding protein [Methanolobus sp. ZRKC2]|uniref:metal ABC transporter solute-binding protein, Zn/Mn family n=1 Tax=Methanolobus sp. ZRKC2 TaxID=3125783 RepID=UPI003249E84F
MNRKKLIFIAFITLCFAFVSGCIDEQEVSASSADKPFVVVSVLPEAEFVEKIGGDEVEVMVMVPPGADPHSYEVTPGQLRDLSNADMYVKVGSGLSFENVWMDRLMEVNPDMLVVDASSGVHLRTMEAHSHDHEGEEHEDEHDHANESEEEHGEEHEDEHDHANESEEEHEEEHDHANESEEEHEEEHEDEHDHANESEEEHDHSAESRDPHIWTSPKEAQVMVENIYDGLVEVDPENTDFYTQNKNAYIAELDAADANIRETLAGEEGSSFIVYHPAWGYFADEYSLEQISVEIEGKEPSVQDMQRLIDTAKEKNIKVIFVQSGFSTTSAQTIANEIDGEVVEVDPLAKDYIGNLANVTAAFEKGLA